MAKIILPIMLMIFLMTGCSGFHETKKLVIGVDDEFAPMTFRDDQENIIGFDVDLAKELTKRLGVIVEFKPIIWSEKEEDLNSGKIDMIWSGLDITPERKEIMIFSKPYMSNRQIIFVKRGENLRIVSTIDLTGKIVGTQAGSTAEDYLEKDTALKNSFREFKLYHSYRNALNALDDGEIDALICDEIVGRYAGRMENNIFEAIDVTIGSASEFGIGFRKNDTKLRDKIQIVFDEMIKDNTAQTISAKWFQADLIKGRR